jgi:hypothetical protein
MDSTKKYLKASEVAADIHLTVGGSIRVGNRGFIHPLAFRALFGEEAFREVMSRPRVVSEYDSWTEFSEERIGNLTEK